MRYTHRNIATIMDIIKTEEKKETSEQFRKISHTLDQQIQFPHEWHLYRHTQTNIQTLNQIASHNRWQHIHLHTAYTKGYTTRHSHFSENHTLRTSLEELCTWQEQKSNNFLSLKVAVKLQTYYSTWVQTTLLYRTQEWKLSPCITFLTYIHNLSRIIMTTVKPLFQVCLETTGFEY